MTDCTRTFIPVASDEANARAFAEAVDHGSDDAARFAREDACQLAGLMAKFVNISPRLWAAMRDDMAQLSVEAMQARGYVDMADLTRLGYSDAVVTAYAEHVAARPVEAAE
jgi:hypothetical protein